MQTHTVLNSNFGANQQFDVEFSTDNLILRAALVGRTHHPLAMLTEKYMETRLVDEDMIRFGTYEMPIFLMKNWHHWPECCRLRQSFTVK